MSSDNHYDGATAIQNADAFICDGRTLVFEFNIVHELPAIDDRIAAAGIPLIATNIPDSDAIYFGVDSYHVGVEAGEHLVARATRIAR